MDQTTATGVAMPWDASGQHQGCASTSELGAARAHDHCTRARFLHDVLQRSAPLRCDFSDGVQGGRYDFPIFFARWIGKQAIGSEYF